MTRSGFLYVCEGNICRSPMAAAITRAALAAAGGAGALPVALPVASAGIRGVDGAPMDPRAAAVLAGEGLPHSGHVARTVTAGELSAAGVVLAATRAIRSSCAQLHPPVTARLFTLTEFSRLCGAIDAATLPAGPPATRLAALVRGAAANRGLVVAEDPGEDDITDPYFGDLREFRDMYTAIRTALVVPVGLLAAAGTAADGTAAAGTAAAGT